MQMLWDKYPELPYRATVPWPEIYRGDFVDWDQTVHSVDNWLKQYIGARWVEWTWGWGQFYYGLDCGGRCMVNFHLEKQCSLFLLRFGSCSS
jgi:hypothetical protein